MKKLIPSLLLLSSLFSNAAFAESALRCPSGFWDLGERVAALSVECLEEDSASLSFCRRELIEEGRACNSVGLPIACRAEADYWLCEDESDGYRAEIRWTGDETIQFRFKGSFSEGHFAGKRF